MKLNEAIAILDDFSQLSFGKTAAAWHIVKTRLCDHANRLCKFCRLYDECRFFYGESEQCGELIVYKSDDW